MEKAKGEEAQKSRSRLRPDAAEPDRAKKRRKRGRLAPGAAVELMPPEHAKNTKD
jgi:hypothetical protein